MKAVALLEVGMHRCRREVEGEGAGHDERCRGVDVLEGQITHKLSLDDCSNVHQVCPEVVHVADGHAGGDHHLDLAEVFLGLA